VIAVDPLGAVKFMNAAAESLTGCSEEQAHGKDFEEVLVLHSAPLESGESVLAQLCWSSLDSPASMQATVAGAGGSERRVWITASPVLANQSAVIGATLIIRTLDAHEQG
jgi:PAS domain S-box-containing protein